MSQVKQKRQWIAITTSKIFFSAALNSKLPSQHTDQSRTVTYADFPKLVAAEAAVRRYSSKKLKKIPQYSQENTCDGISFPIKLRIFQYSVRMRENKEQKKSEYGHFFTQWTGHRKPVIWHHLVSVWKIKNSKWKENLHCTKNEVFHLGFLQ